MKLFYVTAQCDQSVAVAGWHTVQAWADSQAEALDIFNASLKPGWRPASIEGVVEAPRR